MTVAKHPRRDPISVLSNLIDASTLQVDLYVLPIRISEYHMGLIDTEVPDLGEIEVLYPMIHAQLL